MAEKRTTLVCNSIEHARMRLHYLYSIDRIMITFNPDKDYISGIVQGTKTVWVIKNIPGLVTYLIIYEEE